MSLSLQVKRKISLLRSEGVDLSPEGSLTNTTQLFPSSGGLGCESFVMPLGIYEDLLLRNAQNVLSPYQVAWLCRCCCHHQLMCERCVRLESLRAKRLVLHRVMLRLTSSFYQVCRLPLTRPLRCLFGSCGSTASVAPLFKEYCEANPKPCPVLVSDCIPHCCAVCYDSVALRRKCCLRGFSRRLFLLPPTRMSELPYPHIVCLKMVFLQRRGRTSCPCGRRSVCCVVVAAWRRRSTDWHPVPGFRDLPFGLLLLIRVRAH